MTSAPVWRRALLLGLAALCVYCTNVRQMGASDTYAARLVPFSLLRDGDLDLNEFRWIHALERVPYYLREGSDGRIRSAYPLATPLLVAPLAIPFVWWLDAQGVTDPDDVRFRLASVLFERFAAAVLGACCVALLYVAAASLATPRVALAVALVYAFGSNAWVVNSQGLWQHDLAALSVAGTSAALLRAPRSKTGTVVAGLFAALGVAARPTMVLFAALATLYIALDRPRRLGWFLLIPAAGGSLLLLYNWAVLGNALGAYPSYILQAPNPVAAAGLLVSPSRGLLVYTPAVLLAPLGLLWAPAHGGRWLRLLGVFTLAYLLLYSATIRWWGGHTFGPRYLCDTLPALALCAVPAVAHLVRRRAALAAMIAVALFGVWVQVVGVFLDDNEWNLVPANVDFHPERLWAWSDPQWLRAAGSDWQGFELVPLIRQALRDPVAARLVPLPADRRSGVLRAVGSPRMKCRAGQLCSSRVRVRNRGPSAWPGYSDVLHYRVGALQLWSLEGAPVEGTGRLTLLSRSLPPRRWEELEVEVRAPARPGRYRVATSVVQVVPRDVVHLSEPAEVTVVVE